MSATIHTPPAANDARAVLTGWRSPATSQESLRQAYLAFLDARPDATLRTCAPGHLTASAVVFSHDLSQVALVLHGIVGAWIQPGGHIEPDDATLADAARREVREELGLDVEPVGPVMLDVHPITCRGYTAQTRHLDVRFAARARPGAALVCSSESNDVAWWPVDALPEGTFDEVRELIALGHARLRG
ncbi:NUDIX hydrolase [Propioniciclava coleopterorum]|uniref:NUDIX hydrolase n=1 Tax=Propioniciclava coleopterorum TaxID=2714937 RepID=UPI001FE4168E|nr:NUDIX domain-containing protein [Propioniciclava coleopterorum]